MATTGQIVFIRAMEKELKIVDARAKKYKNQVDETISIYSEFIEINKELTSIINEKSRDHRAVLKKLDALKKRDERARKILKRDICSLTTKQVDAESEASSLRGEIYYAKMRAGIK